MAKELKYKTLQYLDRNESQYGPSPKCYEYLKNVKYEDLSWYSRDFEKGIKSGLSKRISDDFNISERQIILSYGSEDLLKQIIHYYLDRKEKILIPKEAWWYYKKVAYEVGGFNVEYPMYIGEDEGVKTYLYDVDKMIEVYERERPRIVLIASPNNPTGNRISSSELRRFLDACRGAIVVIDEAYWGFGSTENDYVKPYIDEFPNLVICRTFSKYYALAGCRIGFAFAGKNLEELINYSTRYLGYNLISEKLAKICLDDETYYREVAIKMEEDKEYLYGKIYKILNRGGIFLNADQVLATSPHNEKIYQESWKRKIDLSELDEENRLAIFDRMKLDNPATLEDNIKWLLKCGFRDVDIFYKYYNFCVLYAKK